MQYQIRNAGTHLLIELSGVPSAGEVEAMLRAMLQASRGEGLKRALVEVRVAKGLDFVATRSAIESLPKLGYAPDFKVAVLLLDDQARRSAEFAQEVAENRGIAVRAFLGRDAALQWLLA